MRVKTRQPYKLVENRKLILSQANKIFSVNLRIYANFSQLNLPTLNTPTFFKREVKRKKALET